MIKCVSVKDGTDFSPPEKYFILFTATVLSCKVRCRCVFSYEMGGDA